MSWNLWTNDRVSLQNLDLLGGYSFFVIGHGRHLNSLRKHELIYYEIAIA
jgi:hypothetical protein